MTLSAAGNIVSIIREIDLSRTKEEAERRFDLLLLGRTGLTDTLALRLSEQPGKMGVHPWIASQQPPLEMPGHELSRYDLALIVTDHLELDESEQRSLRLLHDAGVPVVVVVTNDSLQHYVGADITRPLEAARVLLPSEVPLAAVQAQLAPAMLRVANRSLKLSLARHLPILRECAIRDLIEETSRANALYTASSGLAKTVPILNIPLNVADIVVLSKNQLVMAYKIALMTGKDGEPKDVVGEIIGVVGGGFFFRQVARELVGLVPVIGIIPNVAVSYAGTRVIGHSVYLWTCRGEKLNKRELQRYYKQALSQGRSVAQALVAKLRRRKKEALPPPRDSEDETKGLRP